MIRIPLVKARNLWISDAQERARPFQIQTVHCASQYNKGDRNASEGQSISNSFHERNICYPLPIQIWVVFEMTSRDRTDPEISGRRITPPFVERKTHNDCMSDDPGMATIRYAGHPIICRNSMIEHDWLNASPKPRKSAAGAELALTSSTRCIVFNSSVSILLSLCLPHCHRL
jgi:hypothetical protein